LVINSDLLAGPDMPVSITYINTATQVTPLGTLGHPGVLVTWADGRAFLIDSGMNRADAQAFGKPLELFLRAKPTQTFGPIEQQMDAQINLVQGIGFTHLHSDHTSGVTAICNAMAKPATIYQTLRQAGVQNLHTSDGQAIIDASACEHRTLGDELIKPVAGFPGLVAIAAAGHTPGSTIWATRVDGVIWVFAGDIANSLSDLKADRPKGFIYSYLLIPENTAQLAKWRQWLNRIDARADTRVLVAHDIYAFESSPLAHWQ
ncbi:MAG: MBL fold metallo-hydrolase, partial [Pseudomonadales bacterium]